MSFATGRAYLHKPSRLALKRTTDLPPAFTSSYRLYGRSLRQRKRNCANKPLSCAARRSDGVLYILAQLHNNSHRVCWVRISAVFGFMESSNACQIHRVGSEDLFFAAVHTVQQYHESFWTWVIRLVVGF